MIYELAKYVLIAFGILFVFNLLLTAFGGINPGKFRQKLDKTVILGGKVFFVYLGLAFIFLAVQALSRGTSSDSVVGNIFIVVFIVLLIIVIGSEYFSNTKDKKD